MKYQRSCLRYAHTTGYTSLIYTVDGEFVITCGSDGDIRKWRGIDDDDPTSNCLGEFVICITHKDDRLLASTDRNTVQAYTFPALDNDGTLMRFTAPVTCICTKTNYIAAGSDDTYIKVLKIGESQNELQLEGHTGPILGLDISSKGLLASVAGDGHLKIWNLENAAEVKSIAGLPKVNSFESAVCFGTPCFEPSQCNALAYVKGKEIYVLNTETWEVKFTLSDERTSGDYTCCQFSSDGQFLAAGTTNGEISIFDFMRKQTIKCEEPSSECRGITCIVWHPSNNNELAYCDATGQLGTLFAGDGADPSLLDDEAAEEGFDDIEFGRDDDIRESGELNDNDTDGDGDEDGVSIERLKRKVMKSSEAYANGEPANDEDTRDSVSRSDGGGADVQFSVKTYKQQAAFQPSASPTSLEHRYLVWNNIGIVSGHADNGDGSIDVEFHDASVHHSLHIPNYNNHNMASLSSSVLALSGEAATKLVCIALSAAGNKEWSLQMPDCELVEAIVATTNMVGVATNMHFLRLFSVTGTQREIISIPGPVLALAGHEDRLIICYHSAAPSEHQQHISALLVQIKGKKLRSQQIPMPLPPNRQMTWLGFSDCGSPVFADSMGLVQLFSLKSNCWHPICDTTKESQSVSNNYFVISVSESNQIVQAVLCRASSYPMTNPRPMMQELPMHVPLCDTETEKTDLEDALIRASCMTVDNAEKIIKETAIKLFALACRSEMEMRAKELIETIACPDLLLLAVKYATKLGRIHLSDRLYELMPRLEAQSQREKLESSDFHNDSQIPLSPFALANSPCFGSSTNTPTPAATRLAPKPIDSLKRSSLKRFSMNNSLANFKKSRQSPTLELTAASAISSDPTNDTQDSANENSAGEESGITKSIDVSKSNAETSSFSRSPLNAVNPFASKRKLADADKGILMGANRLKLAKK